MAKEQNQSSHSNDGQSPVGRELRRKRSLFLGKGRPGMAVILVLGLLASVMALSYALIRNQGISAQLQENSEDLVSAEQAALVGLQVGLRKMNQADWGGVTSTLEGAIDARARYSVTFTTGDPRLTPQDPNYADWPFRVTILSTGTVSSPSHANAPTTKQIRGVVRLIPKNLAAENPDWNMMVSKNTVYQWGANSGNNRFDVELPARIEGPVHMKGVLSLCSSYPPALDPLTQYLWDQNELLKLNQPDYRPFTGPITLPLAINNTLSAEVLKQISGVSLVDNPALPTLENWSLPASFPSYRLYPGGQDYLIPSVGFNLDQTTLGPDTLTNPAGIFVTNNNGDGSDMNLGMNVSLKGTVISPGNIRVQGNNFSASPVNLPPLSGTSSPVQLPTIIAGREFRVEAAGTGKVNGVLIAWERYKTEPRSQNSGFSVEGRVVTGSVEIGRKLEWSTADWNKLWDNYLVYYAIESFFGRTAYFPTWLEMQGYKNKPNITITPELSPVRYHSILRNSPLYIYEPLPADGGLRWEVLEWGKVLRN